ncbi:uncharacterized protein AMSG_02720 [Thecamonas trahens ATCC 50062]|uniref:tRNA N(3)-methylcytidine methyltransferase n=1 Tax=Thecamonas trahens ATCC 50062 TaxID=461836 RepID=A0A0L0D1W8_THETB|nr:hypothetical protein AMSG_02720 [Thecamonas trahens ATCC 50062]KNC46267.1 hypothetical protein AMSG_02720 [Thecamonas trahens ATCC 50062]|eukprot:XP_013760561.1 hypothetical protein AMSG_02720 [Thecamonas trahens ATCC 50062]
MSVLPSPETTFEDGERETLPVEYVAYAEEVLAGKAHSETAPAFWVAKYEKEAARNWDIFYKRNTNKFYKDRHWLKAEFPALAAGDGSLRLLEVGCGVGNTIFPLLDEVPGLEILGIDFAKRAIAMVREHPTYVAEHTADRSPRVHAAVADLVHDDIVAIVDETFGAPVDCLTMIFVLSAIAPEHHPDVMAKMARAIRPGGLILMRDYGRYDLAQLRFKKGAKLADNFYVRADGTRAYYFSLDEIELLAHAAGLIVDRAAYVLRNVVNHKEGKSMNRVWFQAVLRRPLPADADADAPATRADADVATDAATDDAPDTPSS